MKLKPNTHYYKISLTIHQGAVGIAYPGYCDHYYLDEDLKVPEFYLTDEQYHNRYDRCIEEHIRATLRRHVETIVLGHETAKVDEEGNVIEETWEWIPGHIEPSKFHMYTLPWYSRTKLEEYITDGDGNLRREEDEAYA